MKRFVLILFVVTGFSGVAHAVINGTPSPEFERHAVMVLSQKGSLCSGAVIAQHAILTAAHCVSDGSDYAVHFRDASGKPILLMPQRIVIHPDYVRDAIAKRVRSIDLAILILKDPLPDFFTPITLSHVTPKTGDHVTIGGYGLTNETRKNSTGKFFVTNLSVIEPHGRSTILLWLAKSSNGTKPASGGGCHGDSGGPLMRENELVGITTWTTGPKGRDCGELTQGALIAPQIDWITSLIR